MNIIHDITESLKGNASVPSKALGVLKAVMKGQTVDGEVEASLYTLFHELLAKKFSVHKVREVFTELGVDKDTTESVCDAWDAIPEVRTGVIFPKLVDVSWVTSHVISTSTIRGVHVSAAEITLHLQDSSGFTHTKFQCDRQHLAELVFKLKSSLSQVEKLAN